MSKLSLADGATIADMALNMGKLWPMGVFPVDHVTLQYLKLTGRSDDTGFAVPKETQEKVAKLSIPGQPADLKHGSVLIAAITSCTNTSNPSVILGAALVARRAYKLGLQVKPWVKTNLAPGSGVVTEYLFAPEVDIDFGNDPTVVGKDGKIVYFRDI